MFRCCVLFYVFKVPEIAAVWVFPSWKKSKDCGLTLGSWYAEPISHHVWIESCTKKTVVGNQKSGENSNQLREGKVVVYPPAIIRGAVAGQDPWVARTVYEYLRTWKSSVLPININHSCIGKYIMVIFFPYIDPAYRLYINHGKNFPKFVSWQRWKKPWNVQLV